MSDSKSASSEPKNSDSKKSKSKSSKKSSKKAKPQPDWIKHSSKYFIAWLEREIRKAGSKD